MDLRSRLDEVRNHLLQIDGDGKPSLASAVAVAGGSSPSSTPGTQITTSMDAIATCLQRLQVSEDRRPSPPFTTTLLVDTSSGDGQAGETSPAQEEVPLRRRASLISSNSSASSVATAVGGNAGTGQQLSGVKSIWGPPVDVALPAGVGLYGQDALTQSPTEQYPSEPANATAPAAETILTSSASLNHFKNLWMAEDGSGQNLLQEYGICDVS
ncbi:hypothetical protein BC829DRAFT_114161 [Chytridium lagenaria]|nr:hypothetical protein BC829DRAFT_114161 [Chytridium lagenaria]